MNDKDWGKQLIQDYGFRLYNPSIGKFLSVDPLAPDYPFYTPYQFSGNNPVRFIDLDGLEQADPMKDIGNGGTIVLNIVTKNAVQDRAITDNWGTPGFKNPLN